MVHAISVIARALSAEKMARARASSACAQTR